MGGRINPFRAVYDLCNAGDIEAKLKADFPILLDVELTNNCNLHCRMCPTGTGVSKRSRGFMSNEIMSKIVAETPKTLAFHLVRWGEPLLHPQCLPFVRRLKAKGHICHITTNGLLLTKELMADIFDSGLDSIKFSFQGVDKKTYERMRQGGDFDLLLANLRTFYELRGDRFAPFIHVTTSITSETQEAVEAFKAIIRPYTDTLQVGRTQLEHIGSLGPAREHEDTEEKALQEQSMVKQRLRQCPEVYDKLSIDWNGQVTVCCRDYNGSMIIGDLLTESLRDLWMGERRRALVSLVRRKEYDKLDICRNCYDHTGLQLKHNRI